MAAAMTCEARYARLESDRLTFLNRARKCAEITIPTLIPPQNHSKSTIYYTPWQGIGARGVNNLASKLLLSLLPPNSPFFRLEVDDFTLAEMAGKPDARAKVEEGLNKIERAVQSEIEGTGMRSPIFSALKNLIVGGNYLIYLPKEGGVRGYRLDSYVVKRDLKGNVLEVIAKDTVSPLSLSDEERNLIEPEEKGERVEDDFDSDALENVDVYTRLYRDDSGWCLYQEIKGERVPGSEGKWPLDKSPMIVLRWTSIENEDYGRSYVEEYLGDLISLEGLSKAVVEASAAAAKVVFLLNPNGVTRLNALVKAESGDVVIGQKQDVDSLQTDKQADMRIAYEAIKTITERLAAAFLMNQSVQRQAERVTAEEVRFMASELEDALGGVYSILSQEFQLPLVNRIMDRMTKSKKLPALPKGIVKPVIVTGLEALGRGHDLNKYNQLLKAIAPLGPEVIAKYMNPGDYISRIATSLGIDAAGLVKNDEQLQQEAQQAAQQQQQMQMMDMAKQAIPHAVKGMSDSALQAQAQPPQEAPAQ
jgi:hypothetical protein